MLSILLNKKAAGFLAAFLFFVPQVFAQKTETYKDIIKKSQSLVLQQDRTQALQVLLSAIQREPAKSNSRKELIKFSIKIGGLFLSDSGQQQFELGRSLRKSDLNQSNEKLLDAQKQEAGNYLVAIELARNYLSSGDCGKAKKIVEQISTNYFYIPELTLIQIQIGLCTQDVSQLAVINLNSEGIDKDSILTLITLVDEAELRLMGEDSTINKEVIAQLLAKAEKIDPKYPETQYVYFKLAQKTADEGLKFAQLYKQKCDAFAQNTNYSNVDPWFCSKRKDIDKVLQKNGIE